MTGQAVHRGVLQKETVVIMKAVLLEFPDEAQTLLKRPQEDLQIVALWPNVQVVLRRSGLPYDSTRPYFDNDSHKRIILTSEEWLQTVERDLDLEDDDGITETYNSTVIFHLRFYINYFLWAIEVVDGIRRSLNGLRGFQTVAPVAAAVKKTDGPGLNNNNRFLTAITRSFGLAQQLEFDILGRELSAVPVSASKARFDFLSKPTSLLHQAALAWMPSGPRVLVNEISYNMDRLVRELKSQFPEARCVWLQTSQVPRAFALSRLVKHDPVDRYVSMSSLSPHPNGRTANRLEQGLASLIERLSRIAFAYRDVPFLDVFRDKITGDLFAHIRRLAAISPSIRRALKKIQPALVLSPAAADADALLGEWTRRLGIPSMSISHGTFTPSESKIDAIEKVRLGSTLILTSFQHTALQTPWAERFLMQVESARTPTPMRTGNLLFARLDRDGRRKVRQELFEESSAAGMKLIVYATTLKPRSGLRFQIHETLDEHLEGISILAKAARTVPEAMLLVKLHPAAALKEDEVMELVPETKERHVRVACRMPFEKVLSAADLLVSYSSTCIEEAILNDIPVLLYDPWNRYQHLPAHRWGTAPPQSAPVYYVGDSDVLTDALAWILRHHRPGEIPKEIREQHVFPPEINNEFLRFVADNLRRKQGATVG
jgi:hypothetical protein